MVIASGFRNSSRLELFVFHRVLFTLRKLSSIILVKPRRTQAQLLRYFYCLPTNFLLQTTLIAAIAFCPFCLLPLSYHFEQDPSGERRHQPSLYL